MNARRYLIFGIVVLVFASGCGGEATVPPDPLGTDLAKDATQTADAAMIAAIVQATAESAQSAGTESAQPTGQNPPADTPVSPTETPAVPTATATQSIPTLSVSSATNCRTGPIIKYKKYGTIETKNSYEVTGRPPAAEPYLIIKNPGGGADSCWAWLNYATVSGDTSNLPIINVPPVPTESSISGLVWDDICEVNTAPATPWPPPGCIDDGVVVEGDGVYDSALESGVDGIVVELRNDTCSSPPLSTTTTNLQGEYIFDHLEAGKYCVTVEGSSSPNNTYLGTGWWTYPEWARGSQFGSSEVEVIYGEDKLHINFGWDYDQD